MPLVRTWTLNATTGRYEVNVTGTRGSASGQPVDADLTSIAALSTTAFGRALLEAADASALRTAAGAQASDSDLTSIAALATTSFGRALLTSADASALLTAAAGQPLDSDLTAIAALSTTSFGRSILDDADAPAALTTLGAQPLDSDLTAIAALVTTAFGRGLLDDADAAAVLATIGAQASDADLLSIAALSTTSFGRSLLALADLAAFNAQANLIIGTGSPEGVTTAAVGMRFVSTDKGREWLKASGAGNTGWQAADGFGNITLPTGVFIYVPHNTVGTSIFVANGECRYTPVYFPHPCTISDIGCEVSTTGDTTSVNRIGVYAMNASLQPGTLLDDSGTVTTSSGTGIKTVTGRTIVIPKAGWYFFAVAQQGAPTTRVTMRTCTNPGYVPPVNTGSGTAAANTGAMLTYTSTGITGALASTPTVTPGNTDPIKMQYKLVSVP